LRKPIDHGNGGSGKSCAAIFLASEREGAAIVYSVFIGALQVEAPICYWFMG